MSIKTFARDPLKTIANHKFLLVLVFFSTLFLGAGAYALIEDYTFLQSLEWATYMMTSTGLGSYGAKTALGQVLGVVLMLWGTVVVMSLVTAFFVSALREDPNAFTDEEQKELLEGNRQLMEFLKVQAEIVENRRNMRAGLDIPALSLYSK